MIDISTESISKFKTTLGLLGIVFSIFYWSSHVEKDIELSSEIINRQIELDIELIKLIDQKKEILKKVPNSAYIIKDNSIYPKKANEGKRLGELFSHAKLEQFVSTDNNIIYSNEIKQLNKISYSKYEINLKMANLKDTISIITRNNLIRKIGLLILFTVGLIFLILGFGKWYKQEKLRIVKSM